MIWLLYNDCLWWFAEHMADAQALMMTAFGLVEC